jgi:hypothetical protein
MLKILTCVVLVCDDCGENPDNDEELHFETEPAALAWAADVGWTVQPGVGLVCNYCTGRQVCKAKGHEWGQAFRCACVAGKSTHPFVQRTADGRCTKSTAWCNRCNATELRIGTDVVKAAA